MLIKIYFFARLASHCRAAAYREKENGNEVEQLNQIERQAYRHY